MADADNLALESPPAGAPSDPPAAAARRGGWPYAHQLAHYEPIFSASNRTLKGWLGIGRAATPPDLPPYDAPERMASWYGKHKKNRVPDHLVALAAAGAAAPAAPIVPGPLFAEAGEPASPACGHVTTTPPAPTSPSPPSPPASAPPAASAPPPARGYSATLERLRQAEAAAGERYTTLILDPDPAKQAEAEQARRSWQLLTKELRAYEKDAEEVLQKSGQSWVAAEVVAVMHELHIPLRDGMLSLYDRIESQLDGLPRGERKRLFRAEVRRLYAALVTHRFTALPPGFLDSSAAALS
jgi:hypothetical protein